MLESFFAFNQNAISNFLFMLTDNMWLILMLVGVIGTIVLYLKEEIDQAVRDDQGIL